MLPTRKTFIVENSILDSIKYNKEKKELKVLRMSLSPSSSSNSNATYNGKRPCSKKKREKPKLINQPSDQGSLEK